jgi:hypothetical protein
MGVFAENVSYSVTRINKDANSLLAFETQRSSWHFIVTREYQDFSSVPIEEHIRLDSCRVLIRRPEQRIWENVMVEPFWACYLVPWNTYDENDFSLGMIPFVHGEMVGKTMRRLYRLNWRHIQTFLSEVQYVFLPELKKRNVLHQIR